MNTYLAIITTALVVTQITRCVQNHISLRRQEQAIKREVSWINDRYVTERDFDDQRVAFRLLREKLEREEQTDA